MGSWQTNVRNVGLTASEFLGISWREQKLKMFEKDDPLIRKIIKSLEYRYCKSYDPIVVLLSTILVNNEVQLTRLMAASQMYQTEEFVLECKILCSRNWTIAIIIADWGSWPRQFVEVSLKVEC